MLMSFFLLFPERFRELSRGKPPSPRRVFSRFAEPFLGANPFWTSRKTLTQKALFPQNETGFRTG